MHCFSTFGISYSGDIMNQANTFATGVHSLALAIASELNDAQLALCAAVLTQLGDILATIAVCRSGLSDAKASESVQKKPSLH